MFAPDLKGFGANADMPYPYALSDYVNDVKEYMQDRGIIKPMVVAHSFGARVAIKAESECPGTFSKMVLCGAAGLKPRYSLKRSFKRAAFSALKKFLPREKLKRFYSPDYLALPGVMRESFKLIVSEHLDGALKNISCPVLLVFGDKDGETPLYMAKRLNRGIKGSRLFVIKGAGHFCFTEKPYTFNREVKEFLLS